jgi:hypothetical protein
MSIFWLNDILLMSFYQGCQLMIFQSPEDAVRTHLEPGEKLLWSGMPAGGIRPGPQDAMLIPFSIAWTSFSVFWEIMVCRGLFGGHNAEAAGWFSWIFPLWGIPFILVGLYLMFGRYWVDAKRRENTFYGITNKGVIIISGMTNRNVKSMHFASISDISMTQKPDGSGTIRMGAYNPFAQLLANTKWSASNQNAMPCLEMISDVNHVCAILRDAHSRVQKKPEDLLKGLNPAG